MIDPYSLTHITHGILFFGLLTLLFKALPVRVRLVIAVGLEAAWEVLENTNFIIDRYRAETVSLGDRTEHRQLDVGHLVCMLDFSASRLPRRISILENCIGDSSRLWMRDNLTRTFYACCQAGLGGSGAAMGRFEVR